MPILSPEFSQIMLQNYTNCNLVSYLGVTIYTHLALQTQLFISVADLGLGVDVQSLIWIKYGVPVWNPCCGAEILEHREIKVEISPDFHVRVSYQYQSKGNF